MTIYVWGIILSATALVISLFFLTCAICEALTKKKP